MSGKNRAKSVPPAATSAAANLDRVPKRLKGSVSNRRHEDVQRVRPGWAFQLMDHDYVSGSWSWDVDRAKLVDIMSFLQQMEKKTWGEIRVEMTGGWGRRGEKHKYLDVQSLCPEAQRRLVDLELDDQDRLFRFRLGNLERLWGVVLPDDHIFYVLWWDAHHKVCPSADR